MFSNGDWNINVRTVGELVEELSRLPKDMPCHQRFADSTDIVVYNRDDDPFVEFESGGEWAELRED